MAGQDGVTGDGAPEETGSPSEDPVEEPTLHGCP